MLSSLQKYFFSLHQKLLGFSLHIIDEISKLLTWLSIASNIYFISDFIFFIFWQLIFNYFSFTSNCSLLMISYFFSLRLQGKCFVQFSYVSFNETFFHEHFLHLGLQGNITFPLRHMILQVLFIYLRTRGVLQRRGFNI